MRSILTVLTALWILTGCSNMKPEDFAGTDPKLVLEDYFAGETQAWGIFEDRFGNLRRQFIVEITGTWDGKELVLDESFHYSDGEKDRRVWRIVRLDEHTYEGRADDVIGVAEGTAYGNAVNWRYDVELKVGDGSWKVRFNDWMFLQPDGILINRARVKRWGFDIGEVTLTFMKPNASNVRSTASETVSAPAPAGG